MNENVSEVDGGIDVTYSRMTETEVEQIAKLYMDYYNHHEDGCWTYEKAYKRIHQIVTMEDSLCLIQRNDTKDVTGMIIGYFKEYDDLRLYYLEEIVIFAEYQNRGYGKAFLDEIEKRILQNGAAHMELLSVDDEHHNHFYTEFGMCTADNLKIMGKHYA